MQLTLDADFEVLLNERRSNIFAIPAAAALPDQRR